MFKKIYNFIIGIVSLFLKEDISFKHIENRFPFVYKKDSEEVLKNCWKNVFDALEKFEQ